MNVGGLVELEILEYSYWEHFKYAKDLALILPLKHPKRIMIEEEMNKMLTRINALKACGGGHLIQKFYADN